VGLDWGTNANETPGKVLWTDYTGNARKDDEPSQADGGKKKRLTEQLSTL